MTAGRKAGTFFMSGLLISTIHTKTGSMRSCCLSTDLIRNIATIRAASTRSWSARQMDHLRRLRLTVVLDSRSPTHLPTACVISYRKRREEIAGSTFQAKHPAHAIARSPIQTSRKYQQQLPQTGSRNSGPNVTRDQAGLVNQAMAAGMHPTMAATVAMTGF